MKTKLFKYTALLFMTFPLLLCAHDGNLNGRYTKEKTIKKEFKVNPDAMLKVSNSYGNLNITSWNGNKVIIEVQIKTNGNNEEKVQKKLDEITVDFESSSNMVSAKTNFNSKKDGWGWGGSGNVNMQVNYVIKVPVKNSVQLNNDYGSIILDRIDGHAKIDCDYGRLEIGELHGRNNQLSFDYTSNSTIGYMNSGEIDADYSGFTIEKAGDLIIKADYTNGSVKQMGSLEYSCDYGKLEIGEAKNISGDGDYISVQLGTIHGNVDLKADYGSLKISKLAPDAGNVTINSNYTGVKIGYDANYNFDFEINTSYAGVSGKEDFEIKNSSEKSSSKYYKGYYGSANSGNRITLSSDYGGITFFKN